MTIAKQYLSTSVSPQPLIHRYYAWPHMVSPHTGALNFRKRQTVILENYLDAPALHAKALENPSRFSGPFLDPTTATTEDLKAFREHFRTAAAPLLDLADDIDAARRFVREHATGGPLTDLYPQLPSSLRGCVELVYDDADQAAIRFIEPLLYRTPAYDRTAQTISLLATPDPAQPFIFNSPLLPSAARLDIEIPFDSPVLDELFAARRTPVDVADLARRLGVAEADRERFAALFTDERTAIADPVPSGEVRMRFFGHASVLLESADAAVMLDPMIGYTDDGHSHFTWADLPERLDAVVLSHAHCDHVSIEALLQLRHRVDRVVVPRDGGGSVLDPSLAVMLRALGFQVVDQLGELETKVLGADLSVTSIPFLGEHADLDIRTKMVPLVELAGRKFLFATDITLVEPLLFERLGDTVTGVDALFVGLECVGAPLSWLYGPLVEHRQSRKNDQARRLNGSDAEMADRLPRTVGAGRVYAYAMGFEPWSRHLTGSDFDVDGEQYQQTQKLLGLCAERDVPAELLYLTGEQVWN